MKKKKIPNKSTRPFNADRCAEKIIKVLKKNNANYWDVEKAFESARNKIFSEKISHDPVSGKYDGEIKIKTRVDTSEIDKAMKKLKKASSLADGLAERKNAFKAVRTPKKPVSVNLMLDGKVISLLEIHG